jgi:hypothetical protein
VDACIPEYLDTRIAEYHQARTRHQAEQAGHAQRRSACVGQGHKQLVGHAAGSITPSPVHVYTWIPECPKAVTDHRCVRCWPLTNGCTHQRVLRRTETDAAAQNLFCALCTTHMCLLQVSRYPGARLGSSCSRQYWQHQARAPWSAVGGGVRVGTQLSAGGVQVSRYPGARLGSSCSRQCSTAPPWRAHSRRWPLSRQHVSANACIPEYLNARIPE